MVFYYYPFQQKGIIMKWNKTLTGVAAVMVFGGGIAACTTSNASADAPANTNPHKDWVAVFNGPDEQNIVVNKRCDGSTLVYVNTGYVGGFGETAAGGIAVVPNSPECQ